MPPLEGDLEFRIRDVRKARGFSLDTLSDETGMAKDHISRLERGLRPRASFRSILQLAHALTGKPNPTLEEVVATACELVFIRPPRKRA